MPFYFRKSVSAGPFRFNFSQSGVGISVGVKGFRVGTGPRGHYIRAGAGGLYYQATLGGDRQDRSYATNPVTTSVPPVGYVQSHEPNVQMLRVSSAAVSAMTDERYVDLLAEMNEKQARISLAALIGGGAFALTLIASANLGVVALVIGSVISCAGAVVGARLDATRRSVVAMYDLQPDAADAYEAMTTAFDRLAACASKWHIDSGGAVRDIHTWKRNAGASTLLDKRPTEMGYALPRVLKTNITPPMIKVGKETLYFLPDLVLVTHAASVGAVAYDVLRISWQDSRFIEEGSVPRDARIVGETWKHPNKNGGPDRRFANNVRIPICLYESIHLTSNNGLNELVQISVSGLAAPFEAAINRLGRTLGRASDTLRLPSLV